jgi:hypothetical protein
MLTIYKYPFTVSDVVELQVPQGAQFLSVQMQGVEACVWALISTDAPKSKARLRIYGTGHPIDPTKIGRYISTFQMLGVLVFHAFEALD